MTGVNRWLSGTCLGVIMVAATPAFAQQETAPASTTSEQPAEAEAEQDIVVTGIRASLAAGLDVKRQNSQFVDSIVATDIGKLPDTNIAESLQRVSGVQIRRSLGEGTSVSIRGLRQNRTEINGRTLVSPSGRGRGDASILDSDYGPLSLFPAELISRLDVIKLAAADRSDGSLSGTVDIITRKPLDKAGQSIALSASGVYADQADRFGFDGSALYSNTFAGDTLGILINATYSRKPVTDHSFNSFIGFTPLTPAFNTPANPTASDPNGDGIPGSFIADFRYQNLDETRERIGGNAAVQWRPSDGFELYGDVVYSHLTTDRQRDWFSVPLSSNAGDYVDYTLSDREILVSGTTNQFAQSNAERLRVNSDSVSGAFGAVWRPDPRFTVRPEFNYSYADLNNTQTFVRMQTVARYPIAFDLTGSDVPELTLPAGLDLTDPSLFRYSNIFDSEFKSNAREAAGRIDFSFDVGSGLLSKIDAGLKYSDLRTVKDSYPSQLSLNPALPGQLILATDRPDSLYSVRDFPGLLNGQASFAEHYIAAEPFGGGSEFACEAIIPALCTPRTFDPLQSFVISEKTMAAYAKIDFETDIGSMPLSGNIGMRYTDTERTAAGSVRRADGSIDPLIAKSRTVDWLPSAVAKLEVTDGLIFRVGAARVVGLPDSIDLSPSLTLSRLPPFNGSAGNPELQPLKADQYDASIEWYFAPGAALTVGAFYKDVKTFIVRKAGFELPAGEVPLDPEGRGFLITRPFNGTGGKVKGVEVLFQTPFSFLPAPFDGFGVVTNFSYIDSETSLLNTRTGEPLPLEGLSKINYNLVGYFEKDGFGARVAYNYRDKFFDSVSVGGEGIFFDSYKTLDASVRYEFAAFTVFADASNLTDAAQKRYTGSPEAVSLYALQGRRFSAGVNVRF